MVAPLVASRVVKTDCMPTKAGTLACRPLSFFGVLK
jgi:hypothetical protein